MIMKTINDFRNYKLNNIMLQKINGGISHCKAAAPYSCEAGGYTPGTVGFKGCMDEIYAGCESLNQ